MGEAGPVRFPGNLDPTAQEFWPTQSPAVCQPQIHLFRPPQLYYPYAAPPTVAFCGVGVSQFHTALPVQVPVPAPTAYVAASIVVAPQQAPLPPPTAAATRALVLTLVPWDVSESKVRKELEVFGEVRGVQMERVREGVVTVHFYDLRHAEKALKEIRGQHMQQQQTMARNYQYNIAAAAAGCEPGLQTDACGPLAPGARGLIGGRAVWAHFIIPASNAVPDGNNQGTVVVFNLDPGISTSKLQHIFQAYGVVKELRETPLKKHQKFVEFYDVRDAAKALREMNGKEINGKQVVIEFSRPGGYSRKFFNNANNISARSFVSRSDSPTKKVSASSGKGNSIGNIISKSSVVETSTSTSTVVEVKVSTGGGCVKKTSAKNNENSTQSTTTVSGSNGKGRAPWKGRVQGKKFDPRFLIISDDAMDMDMVESNCKDSRTTVMIKNIPNKYSQKLLLSMLDNHCIHCNEQIADGDGPPLSSYDFVYLPIDFNNKCNVGYGFVNMTSPQATWRLYKAFHHQNWEVFNSRKICEVTYARVQGLEALKEHFRNSKFPCELDHYLPVVFTPPRDGKQLTDPLPIVGQKQQSKAKAYEMDDDHSVEDEGCNENTFGEGGANLDQENIGNDRVNPQTSVTAAAAKG